MLSTASPSRRSAIAAGALVLWVLVLVFGWAIQPIDDTVPVEVDPNTELAAILTARPELTPPDAIRAQLVECNSLLAADARDPAEPLPELPEDYIYARTPCVDPHNGARLTAVVNIVAVIALVVGWVVIARRFRLDTDAVTRPPAQVT